MSPPGMPGVSLQRFASHRRGTIPQSRSATLTQALRDGDPSRSRRGGGMSQSTDGGLPRSTENT